jgi:hypothetical protein
VLFPEFDSFRTELPALAQALEQLQRKTVQDQALRERFRSLLRSWTYTVQPTLRGHVKNTREFFKLAAELEKIAQLTTKTKPLAEYKRRVRRAIQLSDALVLSLPAAAPPSPRHELFLPEIPDLPLSMVPERLIGCRSKMQQFLHKHPFDHSVFVMIRYARNKHVIAAIKHAVAGVTIEGRPFFPVLASEHKLTDDLYNPIACLLCCSLGIAVFSQEKPSEKHNPNVAYELGMMHLLNRRCLILKHQTLTSLQTDILMKLYESYTGPASAANVVTQWEELRPQEP